MRKMENLEADESRKCPKLGALLHPQQAGNCSSHTQTKPSLVADLRFGACKMLTVNCTFQAKFHMPDNNVNRKCGILQRGKGHFFMSYNSGFGKSTTAPTHPVVPGEQRGGREEAERRPWHCEHLEHRGLVILKEISVLENALSLQSVTKPKSFPQQLAL